MELRMNARRRDVITLAVQRWTRSAALGVGLCVGGGLAAAPAWADVPATPEAAAAIAKQKAIQAQRQAAAGQGAAAPNANAWLSPAALNRPECTAPPKAQSMSDSIMDDMKEASKLLGEKKTDEAIEKLKPLQVKGNEYDKAVVYYNLGMAFVEKQDYATASKLFAKALSYKALPLQQAEQLSYNLGQLYVASGQFDEGINTLKAYVSTACGNVAPEAKVFLASALSERKRYDEALVQINEVLNSGKPVKEAWVQFKLGMQYELKDYKGSADTLLALLSFAPQKSDYWKQLAGVLMQIDDETQAAAVLALAERQGMLGSADDIRNLYSTYMVVGEPLKAAKLLETAVANKKLPNDEKTLESISNAFINARESTKAEETLKQLASMSDRGEYYFRLGGMYGDQERWKESKEMLQRALDKGGLKKPGEAYFRIAVANYSTGDLKGAIAMLQKAQGYDDVKSQASEWLKSLSTEPAPAATPGGSSASSGGAAAPASAG